MQIDVLIVEDDLDLSLMLQEVLASTGLVTFVASDGLDGYNKALELRPRLVLTDVMMPHLRGDEMLARLEFFVGKPVPAIFLTAASEFPRATEHPVVRKPFDLSALLSIVSKELQMSRS